MARLNRNASEAMVAAGVNAATDVTGFGMLGHAYEMAHAANVTISINAAAVPVLEEARGYIDPKFTCGGSNRNAAYTESRVEYATHVTDDQRAVLNDVQTSGGLLIAVPSDRSKQLVAAIRDGGDSYAAAIGEVVDGDPAIVVT